MGPGLGQRFAQSPTEPLKPGVLEGPVGFSKPPLASCPPGPETPSQDRGPSPPALLSQPEWCGIGHTQPAGCSGSPQTPSAWRPGPKGRWQNRARLAKHKGFSGGLMKPKHIRSQGRQSKCQPLKGMFMTCLPRGSLCSLPVASAVLGFSL